jgi:hypothetical protein
MINVASLHYGVIFKKAFSQPHIFTAFVKDCAGVELEIDHVETEKSFSPVIGSVDSRFDLFAEDKKNRIIVDIQHKRLADHYDRFLHYHCTALVEQINSAADYRARMQMITLVVLTSGDRHKTDIAITDFEPKNLAGEGIDETRHKIIYLCPKYRNENTPEPYQEWFKAINDSLDGQVDEGDYNNPILQDIFECIQVDNTSPQEYARMKDEYANEQYLSDKEEQAAEKGWLKGQEIGLEKGREIGIEQEKKKNEQKRQQQQILLIKRLSQQGFDQEAIAKMLGLSIEILKRASS